MGNKKNAKRRQSGSRKNKKSTQEIEEDQLSSDESLTPDAPLRPPCPTPKPYHRGIPAYDACHSNLGAEIDDTTAARLLMSFSGVSPSESQATPARTHPIHPQSARQTSRLTVDEEVFSRVMHIPHDEMIAQRNFRDDMGEDNEEGVLLVPLRKSKAKTIATRVICDIRINDENVSRGQDIVPS
ncbi:hypothetical protein F5876DRAFT_83633 [Lentinula aff. lateritia]|uniref:Uncharacterized protein n=1 Tax=Lentinula aff. lateritia TaxID=2804960 RepID=A0ACC1THC8_9AGAR|nr:hypothetical protein F5876DRAFT_83633 [Lentinula aff. lateritia]